jgi:hypothetical protein
MQKCKECGWEFPDDIDICPYCGHPVEPDDQKQKRRFKLGEHPSGPAPSTAQISGRGMTGAKSLRRLKWHPSFLAMALASAFVLVGLVAGLVLIPLLGGHAQTPPPVLILSGNIVPGGSVSIQGRNFSPGGTVTFTIDGHSATVASHSSTAQHLPPTYGLASLSLSALAPQTARIPSAGTSVPVKSDGTFEVTIQVDLHWPVGSSHPLVATEQSSSRQARLTLVVQHQAELVSCSSSTRTTNIALGPALAGQKQPVSAAFTLCTTGSGIVQWTASWNQQQAKWLQVDRSGQIQAPLSKQLKISASANSLKAGVYSATVTFNDQNSPAIVSLRVMFIVRSAQVTACLNTGTQSLAFTAVQGQASPGPLTVNLSNCGASNSWEASTHTDDSANWLSVKPVSGQLKGKASTDIAVSVSSSQLGQGIYTGQVTFKLGTAIAVVDVMLAVQSPCISVVPQSLTFSATPGQGNPGPQVATVGNCGPAGSWSATASTTDGANWIIVSPSSGSLAANATQDVAITVSSANLQMGTYTGHVTFKLGSSVATVSVTLQPQQNCLSVNPQSLSFMAIQGQGDPAPQSVTLKNCGPSGSWSASTANGSGWLSINPASSNLNAGAMQDVTVSVSIAHLSPDSYSDTITFTISTDSGMAQETVIVSVKFPSCIQASASSLSFVATQGQGDPSPQSVTLYNCGPSGSWSASTANGSGWLSINPASSNLNAGAMQDVTISVSISHLSPDSYSDTIIFTISTGSGKAQVTLAVSLKVQPPPCLQITAVNWDPIPSSSTVSISIYPGSSSNVTVMNCGSGNGTLSAGISTSDGGNWLGTDLQPDTLLAGGGTQTVMITISKSAPYGATGTVTLTLTTSGGTAMVTINMV